jgi:hypothetical protein
MQGKAYSRRTTGELVISQSMYPNSTNMNAENAADKRIDVTR